ncbi:hypothetical protein ABK046_33665 [Streptomyces caeruleatus]
MADPEVQRREPLARQRRAGETETPMNAVMSDPEVQRGRICVLDAGHQAEYPHLGTTPEGQPVAWVGSAPDED